MGAVLHQRVNNAWQPLAFISKKLSRPSKIQRQRPRGGSNLRAANNFCHMLEARHFIIFTYYKPITYAFQQKRDKCSPRQFNHLDYVSQFTTD
jgi:hypothetical protein